MESFETQVKLLTDIVEQKNGMMELLHNIITNQKTLLEMVMGTTQKLSDEQALQIKEVFSEMILEKDTLITKINEGDQVFVTIMDSIVDFEAQAQNHADAVRKLQAVATIAADLDMQIRIAENDNERLITEKNLRHEGFKPGTNVTANNTPKPKVSAKKVTDSYKKNKDFKS